MSASSSAPARLGLVLILFVFLLYAPLAVAQEPPWPRPPAPGWGVEDGLTVSEGFEFGDPDNPSQSTPGVRPDAVDTPIVDIMPGDGMTATHQEEFEGESDVWVFEGSPGEQREGKIQIEVDNVYVSANDKTVWFQYRIYLSDATAECTARGAGSNTDTGPREELGPTDVSGGWATYTYKWTMSDQPMWEVITIRFRTNEAGGTVAVSQAYAWTHCNYVEQKNGHLLGTCFDTPVWPPESVCEGSTPDHNPPEWDRQGMFLPDWMPLVTDHEGVIGLPPGMPADGEVMLICDDVAEPEGIKHVSWQFDYFCEEEMGAGIIWGLELPPGTETSNHWQAIDELEDGWRRCRMTFDASPPPDYEVFHWWLMTSEFSDAVAIDNVMVGTGTPYPGEWFEDFDVHDVGTGLHGQFGWKGWDNDPAFDGFVTGEVGQSWHQSVDVAGPTDLVREFEGFTEGQWVFTAWHYTPAEFTSGGSDPLAGSYFVMLNTYADGGPIEESNWSVQCNFDSNDGMLKVYYGNGMNTVDVPYETDRWVEIQVQIDLDEDWTRFYYDDALVAEYSWTGGVLGGGGGARNIAAVDLFANGSTSVYYDDLYLGPLCAGGDLDGDCDADLDDYVLMSEAMAGPGLPTGNPDADLDGDGDCDLRDFGAWSQLYARP